MSVISRPAVTFPDAPAGEMSLGLKSGEPVTAASPYRQWWMVVCLTVISMLAMVDKNIITLLTLQIQSALGIGKTAIGLSIGTAFALGSLGFGLPAGWMADRLPRRYVIATGVVLWSVMAALCGLAGSFLSLFVARVGVGVGETLVPPSAYSLIENGVDPSRRGKAFGVYAISGILGTGTAFILGGLLMKAIDAGELANLPLVGHRQAWSVALLCTAVLGLPLTLLLLTFPEPQRQKPVADAAATSRDGLWRVLDARRDVLLPLGVFSICEAMLAQSLQAWVPTLVALRFHLPPAVVGIRLGILGIVVGPIGLIAIGSAVDRLTRRGHPGAALAAVATSALILVAVPMHPLGFGPATFWICQSLILLGINAYIALTAAMVASVTPPADFGKVMAAFLVTQALCGAGIAPALTGFVADDVVSSTSLPLAAAMSIVHSILALGALLAALLLLRRSRAQSTRSGPRSG